jgi:hypothetical protein
MSLMEAMMSGAGRGSVLTTMKFAVRPIAKVFTMCFMGFLMATNYIGILNTNGRKLLNGVSKLRPAGIHPALSFQKMFTSIFILIE